MTTFSQVKKEVKHLDKILDGVALVDKSEIQEVENVCGDELAQIERELKNSKKGVSKS